MTRGGVESEAYSCWLLISGLAGKGWRLMLKAGEWDVFFFFSFGAVGSFHGRKMPCLEKCGLVMVFLGFGALRWLWFWCGLYYC